MNEKNTQMTTGIRMHPTLAKERIAVLDILRGFAIFGILISNMSVYSWKGYSAPIMEGWNGVGNVVATWFIVLFSERKFYSLFSFLFGLGVALQMHRAVTRGGRFVSFFIRRMGILLFIGLAHFLFLWDGDILHKYALLAIPLLLIRKSNPKTILRWAMISLLIPIMFWTVVRFSQDRKDIQPKPSVKETQVKDPYFKIFTQGTYQEMTVKRLDNLIDTWTSPNTYFNRLPTLFGLFLLGMYAARRRFLETVISHLPSIRRVMLWGLALGGTGSLAWIVMVVSRTEMVDRSLYSIEQLLRLPFYLGFFGITLTVLVPTALCFFYASGIVLLAQKVNWTRMLAPLGAVGRMALTNYLFQSVVHTCIFYNYGLGLFGKVSPIQGFGLSVLIFAFQIPISVWWLRQFRFGPMEWLWRTLSYGKLQPMIRNEIS
jgi:uncharacterized protein